MYDSQDNHSYNMILGRDILSELRIDLRLPKNTIRVNLGMHKRCTTPMKYISKLILTWHTIGLKTKEFRMTNYGKSNIC